MTIAANATAPFLFFAKKKEAAFPIVHEKAMNLCLYGGNKYDGAS
ncbi:hypothetical protein AB4Z45_04055 [Paenibacillus sp. MCAF9]